jgi:hypothetical protein
MNGYLVVARMSRDDIPVSLHATREAAEEAAHELARRPEGVLRSLEIDWPRSELHHVEIVRFVNGRPVETTRVEFADAAD